MRACAASTVAAWCPLLRTDCLTLSVCPGVLLQEYVRHQDFWEHSRFDFITHCIENPVSQPATSCALVGKLPLLLLLHAVCRIMVWR